MIKYKIYKVNILQLCNTIIINIIVLYMRVMVKFIVITNSKFKLNYNRIYSCSDVRVVLLKLTNKSVRYSVTLPFKIPKLNVKI